MHTLGKVFAWFIVLGAGAAVVLTARTHQVRSSWHKSLSKQRTDYESHVNDLRKAEFIRDAAVVDLANVKRGWGTVWDDVDVRVNPQNGYLQTSDQQTPEVVALAEKRQQARIEKDWAGADAFRDELNKLGWSVKDGQNGYELKPL